MRAAVLCPGPGLELYPGRLFHDARGGGGYDLVIGVNRAVLAYRCDWWSVCDIESIEDIDLTYDVPIFTTRSNCDRNKSSDMNHRWNRLKKRFYEDPEFAPARNQFGWSTYSATAAIVLAFNHGCQRIDEYGSPLGGDTDHDGHTLDRYYRADERWRNERSTRARLLRELRREGCRVKRYVTRRGNG